MSRATCALTCALAWMMGPDAQAALDVVFVLDTTGSMSSEIHEAKERIRDIAGALTESRVGERVRTGVVAFRDREDEYVTMRSALSEDVQDTFAFLSTLSADGGGDYPEDVLEGLRVGVEDMAWDDGADVSREIFLIGDAPPHLDYDGPTLSRVVDAATARRITIHGVGCRSLSGDGRDFFQRVAYATEGRYQHIGRVQVDDGGLAEAVVSTLAGSAAMPEPVDVKPSWSVGPSLVEDPIRALEVRVGLWTSPRMNPMPDAACWLTVLLPDGMDLAGDPDVGRSDLGLHVTIPLLPGIGGVRTFSMEPCASAVAPVRVDTVEG